jgi:hypothetical protein
VQCLAHRARRFRRIAEAAFADHHHAGADADAYLQRFRAGDRLDGLGHLEPGAHRALGGILVGGGPAEIGLDGVAAILRDVTFVTLDDRSACTLEGLHHAPEILGVERSGKPRGVDEVAEHHGDLAALGLASLDRSARRPHVASRLPGSQLGDGGEQFDARTDR